jgi:hypothetical protein
MAALPNSLRELRLDPEVLALRCEMRAEELQRLHGFLEEFEEECKTPDEHGAWVKAIGQVALAANCARIAADAMKRIADLRNVRRSIGLSRMMRRTRPKKEQL